MKTFADTSLLEAVARQVRVDLVVKAVRPGDETRLVSRFLAFDGPDRIVLEVPTARGRKVFVPAGWRTALAFSVGHYVLQAPTTVLGICQFPIHPTRRVDALLVERPARIAAVDRRRHPRKELPPNRLVFVSIWPADRLAAGAPTPAHSGRVLNRSAEGMGIRLETPLPCDPGALVILRLEQGRAEDFPIYRAVLRHLTREAEGFWLAGFGGVTELDPGQAPAMIEAIAAGHR